jgi:hypothetical protein
MRAKKDNPEQKYNDFWDWLFNYKEHFIFVVILMIGYVYYLNTTEEI